MPNGWRGSRWRAWRRTLPPTPRGYVYVGHCRCGFGPHAFFLAPDGRVVHISRLLWGVTTPITPSPPEVPPALKPEDEMRFLEEQRALVEDQVRTLEEGLKKIDERVRELKKAAED